MAKIALKLDELIDGAALRRDLTALTAATEGDGGSPAVRGKVLATLKDRVAAGRAVAERMLTKDGGGTACAARLSHLMDEAIRALYLTLIMIALRPDTIASAERVIVLQGGRVTQDLRRAAA